MSVKLMGLVWDLDNSVIDREEKYILLAYADHADHKGYNIFPSIELICQKTGYKERAAQLITRSLEEKGFLVADGKGRHGTNKWYIPLDNGGAKIAPVKNAPVQKTAERGAKPTGEGVHPNAPEPEEPPEPSNENIDLSPECILWGRIFETLKPDLKGNFKTYMRAVKPISLQDGILRLGVIDDTAREWMEDRMTRTINNLLIGIVPAGATVEFVTEAA